MNIISFFELICIIYISLVVFYLIFISSKLSKYTVNKIEEKLKCSSKGVEFYEELNLKLSKNGMKFRFKGITPVTYIITMVCISLGVFIFSLILFDIKVGIISFIITFFLVDLVVNMQNSEDNEKMMDSLKKMFSTVKIQTKAGSHITDALTECYLVVSNKRLKTALLEFNNKVLVDRDMIGAVEELENKFNNRYLTSFCIAMKQALRTGKTVKMLEDLEYQVDDLEDSIALDEEKKTERKLMFAQILIFIGIIMLIAFVISVEFENCFLGM